MNSIRRIANSEYFAIPVNGQDDWIMRPALGRLPPAYAGMSPNAVAWFFDAQAGFVFYDVASRQLVGRLRTPLACGFDEAQTPGAGHCALVEAAGGRRAYLLLYHRRVTDLHVIDLERREIIRSALELPGAYWLCKPVLDGNGRLLVPAILHDDATGTGLLRIDPDTGNHEVSVCDGPRSRAWLVHSSPCGRYWLRADDSRLPMIEEKAPTLSRLFGAAPKEHFSFAVEIWEAFPLRRLHSVTPMWMTAEELPDEGHIDYEARKKGLPAQRGKVFRKISQLLDQDATLTAGQIHSDTHPDLWPDRNTFYSNINSNLSSFAFSERAIIGWQPDNQAFWLERNNFVSCVGVDGTVSPKIRLERFGMQPGTWLPCARSWYRYEARPLPDRRLDLRFEEGIVTVSGTPGDPAHQVRIVPQSEDHFRPYQPSQEQDKDAALAKRAEAIAKKYSVYAVDLASMSEADCIAAIEALASRIGPDINERVFDNRIQAVFRLDGKRLNEKKFFTHVAKHCPNAAPALKRLIEAACEHVGPHTFAWYDPYADDELPTGLFGYAAWCLASLDRSSNDVLVRYRKLIDTYHENFYFEKTVPLMLDNAGDASERLQLAEGFFFDELGNSADHATFWRMAKMAVNAASSMAPRQYAARLLALAASTSAARSESDLGYYCFDNLERLLAEPTDWEKALLQEIRNAVRDLARQ